VTGRGRHTTTSALALPLSSDVGGWVVDTPGRVDVGRSGWPTSTRPGSSTPSPTSYPVRRTARAPAATTSPTARWTPGSPRGTPTRRGCTRCAGCWPPGKRRKATDLRVVGPVGGPVSA
jgi:hypothetical protein